MSDYAEIQSKLLSFIMQEWGRKDHRQLVSVDLLYSPGHGFTDNEIRSWVRSDEPELFAEFKNIEALAQQIVEISIGEADAKPAGKHRFVVRCKQHGGSRPTQSFALSPSYNGGSDDSALVTSGGGGGRDQQVIAGHASQLMRINAQMFEGTIRVLGQQNSALHQQVTQLTSDNAVLRHELEEARSTKMDKEFQMALAAEKSKRTSQGFQQLMQLGSVIQAKIAGGVGGGGGDGNTHPSMTPLGMLIADFYKSLRDDQKAAVIGVLDMSQKMMFMEIANMAKPPESEQAPGASPS